MRAAHLVIALALLMSFGCVFLVSAISLTHTVGGHRMAGGMLDCPFMSHHETLCPMDVLDHLTTLRTLFEGALPGVLVAVVTIGIALSSFLVPPGAEPALQQRILTMLRWRHRLTACYVLRPYQELYSHGVLNPKLFS